MKINDTWECLWGSGNSNGKGYVGILKMQEHEKHVDIMQTMQIDKLQWMAL